LLLFTLGRITQVAEGGGLENR